MKNRTTRRGWAVFRKGGARCTHHVQQGECIAVANYRYYPECDAHSFARIPDSAMLNTVSDIDSDDSEVDTDMGKLKGRRAASSPSAAAYYGPAGAGGVRNSSKPP